VSRQGAISRDKDTLPFLSFCMCAREHIFHGMRVCMCGRRRRRRRRRQDSVDAINYILCGEMSGVTDDAVKGSY